MEVETIDFAPTHSSPTSLLASSSFSLLPLPHPQLRPCIPPSPFSFTADDGSSLLSLNNGQKRWVGGFGGFGLGGCLLPLEPCLHRIALTVGGTVTRRVWVR